MIALVLAAAVVLAAAGDQARASHLADNPKKHKIVYQLDDPGVDKAKFVLNNIRNHIAGVGGWEHIEALELVVFGPALRHFTTKTMDPDLKQALEALQGQGMAFGACGNTMKAMSLTLEELPRGATHLPQGGVVRVMELQERGYAYIRP
ncbi:MAG TPA: DsrE family protein [Methylomirabilota bacterium]|nr:DsrE family protein [Methylomirabilota bacterium]